MSRYPIIIESAGSNYSAYSPDLPGCIAIGGTPEEAQQNMIDAIGLHLDGLCEDGLPIPEPSATAG